MWNEHCSYKSSRLHLKKLPTKGKQVIQGPGENAGVVDIEDLRKHIDSDTALVAIMAANNETGVIQDRTIYEDVEIFAKNLHEMNHMANRDWKTYNSLFANMIQFLRKPDLIIYLRASTDTLLSRIKNRDRNFEKNISAEYLHSLNLLYDRWIDRINHQNVYVVESDGFNIFKDKHLLDKIIEDIEKELE